MLKIHHIGYLTDDIIQTAKEFKNHGYCVDEIVHDDIQKTHICFLRKLNDITIELVQPYEDNRTMNKMVVKRGVSPYHICYESDNVFDDYNRFVEMGYTPLFRPVPAKAIDDKLICYFWKSEVGFIEIVNK